MSQTFRINEAQKKHLLDSLKKGVRFDGRKLDQHREVSIEYSISKSAEGSARVRIGETEVIAGVKLSIDKPYADSPDEGSLMVDAQLLPLSSPEFELGPPSIEAIELARVVDRGIREAKAIDTKKLCVKEGEKVWIVSIDICTINNAGNLFDASALAAIAALKDARFPEYDGVSIDYKKHSDKKLPLTKIPVAVTVFKAGSTLFIDPSLYEEQVIDARLTVTMMQNGELCALQKGEAKPLSIEEINQMIDLGISKAKELTKHIQK